MKKVGGPVSGGDPKINAQSLWITLPVFAGIVYNSVDNVDKFLGIKRRACGMLNQKGRGAYVQAHAGAVSVLYFPD